MPDELEKPSNPSPPTAAEQSSVWLIEVPSSGYRWFTTESDRAAFWSGRSDAIVTCYVRSDVKEYAEKKDGS